MSKVRVAINGFGRIGRAVTRLLHEHRQLELVAINNPTAPEQNAHLLKYDSIHGTFGAPVSMEGAHLRIGTSLVKSFALRDPSELPWKQLGVDIVMECTGQFTHFDSASKHLSAGAKKIIISAPVKDPEKIPTVVYGINHTSYNPNKHDMVSNASCTTNCLAPVVQVIHQNFKIISGFMTTIHSYTNDQRILDLGHNDYRRMRAAAVNMIPTTTGAASAVGLVMPDMIGKLTGIAVRVPTPNVSLVDFVANVEVSTTAEEVNRRFTESAESGPLKGILAVNNEPLVSSDYNGNKNSSTIDMQSTMVLDGTMIKVLSWYDNEIGFSMRMVDLAAHMAKSLNG